MSSSLCTYLEWPKFKGSRIYDSMIEGDEKYFPFALKLDLAKT